MDCLEIRHGSGRSLRRSQTFGKPSVAVVLIGCLLLQAYVSVARRVVKTSSGRIEFAAARGTANTLGRSPGSSLGSSSGQENLQLLPDYDFCNLPVRGLTNPDDSSCFINSAMQFMMAVPGLCEVVFNKMSLLAADEASALSEPTVRQSPVSKAEQAFLRAYLKMFRKVYSHAAENRSVSARAIDELRAGLHHVKLVHDRHGEEDSQEFLLSLLNRFNDSAKEQASVLSHVGKYQQFKWENPLPLKEDSVSKEGASSSCNEDSPALCKTTGTKTRDVMILLPIQLPFSTSSDGTTLQDKFNLEFKTDDTDDPENALQVLKEGKTYEFAKWSMHTEAMMPPPKYLLFGYKRFDLNYDTYEPIKLDDDVTTPLEMFHPACDQRPTHLNNTLCPWHYRLEAVVQHIGSSAGTGHYIAAVRGRGSAEERQKWYNVSDSFVDELELEEVQQIADKCLYAGYVLTNGDDISRDLLKDFDMVDLTADRSKDLSDSYGKLVSQNLTTGLWGVELSGGLVISVEGDEAWNDVLEAGDMVRLRELTTGQWVVEPSDGVKVDSNGDSLATGMKAMEISSGDEELL